jgi:5-formyltetrahydrofolate cyclo-ligase
MHLIARQKEELRNHYRRERQARFISATWRRILESPEICAANSFASYFSYGYEPETHDLNQLIFDSGRTIYLPRMLPDKNLEWIQWDGVAPTLTKKQKFFEPTGPALADDEINSIEVIIIPALHVDRDGNRLGQGGGSYDRALAKMSGWKIALVHSGEMTSEPIPHDIHDQKVDAAATPELIVRFHS